MRLGIPTLCCYDLLDELLKSAERGSMRPSSYIIVDNGNAYPRARLNEVLGDRAAVAELIAPGHNIGVSAAWNRMLIAAGDEPIVISNDDVLFGYRTFEEMARAVEEHPFVEGDGWALFAQQPSVLAQVGFYDENFYPAYYEDVDYDLRLTRAGITPFRALSGPLQHVGWATTRALDDATWLNEHRARNHSYFLRKWGAESANPRWNGHAGIQHYAEAFNGHPPVPGWNERVRLKPLPMRWDILNHVAKAIGAERYLEIGVADGACMRRIEVHEKWGVDPHVNAEGVRACTVFVPQTSQAFFETIAPQVGSFDLIFIDGDHRAEQVEYEIEASMRILSPKGIIVLHDCNPHTEAMQQVPMAPGEWTGDVWKAIARQRAKGLRIEVVDSDYGVGICYPRLRRDQEMPELNLAELGWADLVQHRHALLGLVNADDWECRFERQLGVME